MSPGNLRSLVREGLTTKRKPSVGSPLLAADRSAIKASGIRWARIAHRLLTMRVSGGVRMSAEYVSGPSLRTLPDLTALVIADRLWASLKKTLPGEVGHEGFFVWVGILSSLGAILWSI